MIEHMIGDNHVTALVNKRQGLDIRNFKGKWLIIQSFACLLEHSRREICQSYLPSCRDAVAIAQPEQTRSAAELNQLAGFAKLDLIEDPAMPAIFINAETST